jgi:hypothetical protein
MKRRRLDRQSFNHLARLPKVLRAMVLSFAPNHRDRMSEVMAQLMKHFCDVCKLRSFAAECRPCEIDNSLNVCYRCTFQCTICERLVASSTHARYCDLYHDDDDDNRDIVIMCSDCAMFCRNECAYRCPDRHGVTKTDCDNCREDDDGGY